MEIDTVSGSVKIALEGTDSYKLDFNTVSGSVRDDYAGTKSEHSGTFNRGNGDLSIEVSTTSGSIRLTDWH